MRCCIMAFLLKGKGEAFPGELSAVAGVHGSLWSVLSAASRLGERPKEGMLGADSGRVEMSRVEASNEGLRTLVDGEVAAFRAGSYWDGP